MLISRDVQVLFSLSNTSLFPYLFYDYVLSVLTIFEPTACDLFSVHQVFSNYQILHLKKTPGGATCGILKQGLLSREIPYPTTPAALCLDLERCNPSLESRGLRRDAVWHMLPRRIAAEHSSYKWFCRQDSTCVFVFE